MGDTWAFSAVTEDGDPEFDTFDITTEASAGSIAAPLGNANAITGKGDGGTGFSALLPTPTFLGGMGLSPVGLETTETKTFQAYALLGGLIDLSPETFLSQVQFSTDIADAAGTAVLQLFRSGNVVGTASTDFGGSIDIPEPAALGLLSMVGLLGFRRRR